MQKGYCAQEYGYITNLPLTCEIQSCLSSKKIKWTHLDSGYIRYSTQKADRFPSDELSICFNSEYLYSSMVAIKLGNGEYFHTSMQASDSSYTVTAMFPKKYLQSTKSNTEKDCPKEAQLSEVLGNTEDNLNAVF